MECSQDNHSDDRAESLIPHHRHRMVNIGQHHTRHKLTLAIFGNFGLSEYLRALSQRVVYMLLNRFHLFLGRHCADVRCRADTLSNANRFDPLP